MRFLVLLLLLGCVPVAAQENAPTPRVTVAPAETKEIIAEGRAAIGTGGVPGAREAATAQALRAAVEKATGLFVSARTPTGSYRLLQDEVTTRAQGFATLKEVVSEKVLGGEMRVTVRALVSLRPLAKRLKELNLTRAWRVRVEGEGSDDITAATALPERTLGDAGFVVVSRADDADVVVGVTPKFTAVAATPLETAVGSMTLHSLRGEVSLRAVRTGTDEVVAALTGSDVIAHVDAETARSTTLGKVAGVLAPRLADALLLLPARDSQPVTLVVSNLARITDVGKLHDALRAVPGVRRVTRRSWEKLVATWELDVTTDAVPLLARALEEDAGLRPFGLVVSAETRARIVAYSPAFPSSPPSKTP